MPPLDTHTLARLDSFRDTKDVDDNDDKNEDEEDDDVFTCLRNRHLYKSRGKEIEQDFDASHLRLLKNTPQ